MSTAAEVLGTLPKSLGQIDKQQLTAWVEARFECVLTVPMAND
jgi:hypothetical protein